MLGKEGAGRRLVDRVWPSSPPFFALLLFLFSAFHRVRVFGFPLSPARGHENLLEEGYDLGFSSCRLTRGRDCKAATLVRVPDGIGWREVCVRARCKRRRRGRENGLHVFLLSGGRRVCNR